MIFITESWRSLWKTPFIQHYMGSDTLSNVLLRWHIVVSAVSVGAIGLFKCFLIRQLSGRWQGLCLTLMAHCCARFFIYHSQGKQAGTGGSNVSTTNSILKTKWLSANVLVNTVLLKPWDISRKWFPRKQCEQSEKGIWKELKQWCKTAALEDMKTLPCKKKTSLLGEKLDKYF